MRKSRRSLPPGLNAEIADIFVNRLTIGRTGVGMQAACGMMSQKLKALCAATALAALSACTAPSSYMGIDISNPSMGTALAAEQRAYFQQRDFLLFRLFIDNCVTEDSKAKAAPVQTESQISKCAATHNKLVAPALERVGDFAAFLGEDFDEALTYYRAEKIRDCWSSGWFSGVAGRDGGAYRKAASTAKKRQGASVKWVNMHLSP